MSFANTILIINLSVAIYAGATVVGMDMDKQVFPMAIPTKVNTSLINDMDREFTVGMMVESTMECLVKTNDMAREILRGPMVPFTMENLSMDNEMDTDNIHFPMVDNILDRGRMDDMMDLGTFRFFVVSVTVVCFAH